MTVITRLNGGLGNQLFQVSMGLAVAKAAGSELYLDEQGLANTAIRGRATKRELEVANLGWDFWPPENRNDPGPWWLTIARGEGASAPMTALGSLVNSLSGAKGARSAYIKESAVSIELSSLVDELASKEFVYLSGYWADKAIPNLVREEISEALLSVKSFSDGMIGLRSHLEACSSIAIHVRRGDFFTDVAPNHGFLKPEYFLQGIEELYESGDQLFFFSDDPGWCRETFKSLEFARFVEPNPEDAAIDHLVLMSKAKKFVVSNSSFSWWSAWLSAANGGQIIRPEMWVTEDKAAAGRIYPDSWRTLGGGQ